MLFEQFATNGTHIDALHGGYQLINYFNTDRAGTEF